MALRSESPPPSKASLRAWWKQFTTAQKAKKDLAERESNGTESSRVFGAPLRESLQYASVQISTANANGELYVWGYIPVVVAKCGLYLKENATEVPGTFRVSGSTKRMRNLQALFETPPRYGKTLDLTQGHYTTHDVASVFRRYLTSMPEPVIPHELYHDFREALSKTPFNQDTCIQTYKRLIRSMPRANQYLLLYVLDLLSVFARKCDTNLMTATNLAVIFRPGLISHPVHELSPDQHRLSQEVLEFLIAHQDWFMLDIPPPPASTSGLSATVNRDRDPPPRSDDDDDVSVMVVQSSDEEYNGWKLVERRGRKEREPAHPLGRVRGRRRTTSASERSSNPSTPMTLSPDPPDVKVVSERPRGLVEGDMGEPPATPTGSLGVTRSRTLPASRSRAGTEGSSGDEAPRHRNVLRKSRGGRTSLLPGRSVPEESSEKVYSAKDDSG